MKKEARFAPLRVAGSALLGAAILFTALGSSLSAAADSHSHHPQEFLELLPERAREKVALHDEMRVLWEDHIVWTRQVIISVAHDLPDLSPTVARLLRNQVDIGNLFRRFYGDRPADRLTELLTEHIEIAAEILVASKAGDTDAAADAVARWFTNGEEIAIFFNRINPRHLPLDEARAAMKEHLDTTLEEAVARLSGDFPADIIAYDRVHEHILGMSDFLSNGIIKQFPRVFDRAPWFDAV